MILVSWIFSNNYKIIQYLIINSKIRKNIATYFNIRDYVFKKDLDTFLIKKEKECFEKELKI
jgi:hypothetical protein